MNYFFTPIDTMPENLPFRRVGIVPFFVENETINFFLMLDSRFKELTDCGGLPKENEKWLQTAVRETEEESRGVFVFQEKFISEKGKVFWREDHRIAIIFIDVTDNVKDSVRAGAICHKYRKDFLSGLDKKDKKDRLENSDMSFYSEKELRELCKNNGKIYTPVKKLFCKFLFLGFQKKLLL